MLKDMQLSFCENISISKFQYINDDSGRILVLQKELDYKFDIIRFFLIYENKNSIRGMHAHKKCFQFFNLY